MRWTLIEVLMNLAIRFSFSLRERPKIDGGGMRWERPEKDGIQ